MKKLLLLAVALLGTAYAQAQTIAADDVLAVAGQNGTITVALDGVSDDVRDVQFSFVVPTGLNLGTPTVGDGASDASAYDVAMSDPAAVTGGNKYTVVVYSATGETFGDGAVLNIPVAVPSDYAGAYWDTTDFDLDGIAFTIDDATETAVADDTYKFEVGLLGDVNKSGDVALADAGLIYQYMESSTTPASLGNFAIIADLNEDGEFSLADAGLVYNIVEANGSSVKEEVDFFEIPADVDVDWAD